MEALLSLGAWLYSGSGSAYYYTQIDNSKISEGKPRDGVVDLQGGMSYSYTLPAYNEKGVEKEITFGASRSCRMRCRSIIRHRKSIYRSAKSKDAVLALYDR